jgi:hypothetical protein
MTRANYEHHEAALPPKDLKRELQIHHGSAKLGFLVAIVEPVLFAFWSPALVSLRPVLVFYGGLVVPSPSHTRSLHVA